MTGRTIPIMRPRAPNAAALRPYLEEIDKNGWYSNFGPLERRLEKRLADHFRLPKEDVVCVANCTVGLMLALAASAPRRGGYCVMPSFTFVASAHAVLAAGLTPLFIDVDADSWSITAEQASEAIRAADGDVAAILAVSPFGAPVDVAMWDTFTEKNGVPVVIDAAGGFDSVVPGKSPVVVSLHATKVLPAGEGGIVLSRDPDLIESIFARSNFGFRKERQAEVIGFNGKLNEYCAAVGLASLDAWPTARASFSHLTGLYSDALGGIENVRLAPGFGEGWVGSTCNIALERPAAEKLMTMLAEAGIDSRQWWSKGCHRENAFAGYPHGDLSVTDFLGQRVVGLPFYDGIESAEIERIAGIVAAAAQH